MNTTPDALLARVLSLLLAFLIVGMCGFCHAPEHAYDVLADHPTISRDQLCRYARERPLMATTPKPNFPRTTVYWDDEAHDWRPYRIYGRCDECGKPTWKYAHETNAAMVWRRVRARAAPPPLARTARGQVARPPTAALPTPRPRARRLAPVQRRAHPRDARPRARARASRPLDRRLIQRARAERGLSLAARPPEAPPRTTLPRRGRAPPLEQ